MLSNGNESCLPTPSRGLLPKGTQRFFLCSLLALALSGQAGAASSFSCTEVLGFSQSMEWFGGFSLAATRGGVPVLQSGVFLPAWQGRFQFGAAVELWRDADYEGWEGRFRNPSRCDRATVDRVLFNVSGAARDLEAWVDDVAAVVEVIRDKYPLARQVVLQPVVGAQPQECQEVRAAQNHPTIVEAIDRVALASDGSIVAGLAPKVTDCGQFSDRLGHLSAAGALSVKESLVEYYSRGDREQAR